MDFEMAFNMYVANAFSSDAERELACELLGIDPAAPRPARAEAVLERCELEPELEYERMPGQRG